MPRIACILNPKARDGVSAKRWPDFETALVAAGFETDLYETNTVGHGMNLAYDLLDQDYEMIVAVGGDGTVHEVASALRGSGKTLGILPIGSGNDFARALGIPLFDVQGAVDLLTTGTDHSVGAVRAEGPPASDLANYKIPAPHPCNGDPESEGNHVRWSFLEIDGGVTSSINRMKIAGVFSWIRGQAKYTALGIKAILGWKTQPAWVKINGAEAETLPLQGLFVISQCQTFGGGYKVAPGIHPKRDTASLILALGLSKLQMLLVMGPLEKGKHLGKWGKISMQDCKRFEIGAVDSEGNPSATAPHSPPLFINVDGEACLMTPCKFEFHPNQLIVRGATTIPNE
ncbi:MAG: hypothetical protein CMA85_04405 [Euryarchaeota archaeon]|nr:hypothetical protein [Euryarchaeota archaeon]